MLALYRKCRGAEIPMDWKLDLRIISDRVPHGLVEAAIKYENLTGVSPVKDESPPGF
jgi:hypothetical protein